MRTENDEIRDNLKYLTLLSRDYPSQAAAASEIISTQALLKLPKGTEHFMSDLHGENEAFVHILNSASGVIREKVDLVLGEAIPEQTRAELATLIYYPNEKLPQLKNRCTARKRWTSGTPTPCCGSLTSVGWYRPNTPATMCGSACRPAAAISWTSCSTPILRTTTKICIMGRSWAASSRTVGQTVSSCGCAS